MLIKQKKNLKTFLCSQSVVLKISRKFMQFKSVQKCISFGILRATSEPQDHTLLKYSKIWGQGVKQDVAQQIKRSWILVLQSWGETTNCQYSTNKPCYDRPKNSWTSRHCLLYLLFVVVISAKHSLLHKMNSQHLLSNLSYILHWWLDQIRERDPSSSQSFYNPHLKISRRCIRVRALYRWVFELQFLIFCLKKSPIMTVLLGQALFCIIICTFF